MFEPLLTSYMNALAATALAVGTFVAGALAGWLLGTARRRSLRRDLAREMQSRRARLLSEKSDATSIILEQVSRLTAQIPSSSSREAK